jgi:putative membrane protein
MRSRRFSFILFSGPALALLSCAALVAQNPGGMPGGQQQPIPQQTQPGMPGMGNGPSNSAASMADQSFISDSMQGNLADVKLSQLAEQKSGSNDVKQVAQKLESEDSQMNQKWFEPEAKALQISVPKKPSKKENKEVEKLQGLSGADFDKGYITAMLEDQQKDLKEFKDESDAAQDPNIKRIAQMGTKVITEHLQVLEQVAKLHNVPVSANGKEVSSN